MHAYVVVGEVSMYVCVLWVPEFMSVCACVCVDTRGYVRCSVYHSTLHSFETGSPAAPGARLIATPRDSPASVLHSPLP